MSNDPKRDFLAKAYLAASAAHHPFPAYAACEAAEESGFGTSSLAVKDNNLFGMKQHTHPVYGDVALPTREFLDGQWQIKIAEFVKYPDWLSCFSDRLATLGRLASAYPHYAAALAAPDGPTFITEVSQTWSTDPERGAKVLALHDAYAEVFA